MCRREKRISLLQVGDIHFPDSKNQQIVDYKDENVPAPFIETLSLKTLPFILKKIHSFLSQKDIHGILFCGDLTSGGSLEGYKECLSYLKENFLSPDNFQQDQVHAVPGNHDIDRDTCDPTGADNETKFETLRTAWKDIGFPVLNYRNPIVNNSSNNKVSIYSMNSCIGCGVIRNYPKEISEVIFDKISELHKSGHMTEARYRKLKEEVLDTPAFLEEELSTVQSEIQNLSKGVLPVILAHHNILPQFTPRVSVYGELLNAGFFRDSLIRNSDIILYCHGHIHEDPIEVISTPQGNHRIVCISAPELVKGFNIIHIEYSSQNIPLGCVVEKCRVNRGDMDHQVSPISFYGPESIGDMCGSDAVDVARTLTRDPQRVKDIYNTLNKRVTQQNIALYLSEMEWLGVVQINNKDRSFKEWHVTGKIL